MNGFFWRIIRKAIPKLGIHAREWISPATVSFLARELGKVCIIICKKYVIKNPQILRRKYTWYKYHFFYSKRWRRGVIFWRSDPDSGFFQGSDPDLFRRPDPDPVFYYILRSESVFSLPKVNDLNMHVCVNLVENPRYRSLTGIQFFLTMVVISEGNLEIDAHCSLIFIRHFIRSRAVTNRIFSRKRPVFLHACATCSKLPTNISTMKKKLS